MTAPIGPASTFLAGRRVRLQVLQPEHSDFLYELHSSPHVGGRMRFYGATPSPEEVSRRMWEGVLAQFVAIGVATEQPLGQVVLDGANFRDRHCHLSVLGHEAVHRTGLLIEASLMMLNYAFEQWDFRKIYFDALEPNLRSFKSATSRLLDVEGQLRGHHFMDGKYVDLFILAFHREKWEALRSTLLDSVFPTEPL